MSDTPKVPKGSFVNRNLVAIVVIPGIIAIHYGWTYLQKNESLVPSGKPHEQPIFDISRRLWAKLQGQVESNAVKDK